MGHARQLPAPGRFGLYRIRRAGAPALLYIWEGKIAGRRAAHLAKAIHPDHRQAAPFGDPDQLEVSWVLNDNWYTHQRLELENDLTAAHILVTSQVPDAQFLG